MLDPDRRWAIKQEEMICDSERRSFRTDFTDVQFYEMRGAKNGAEFVLGLAPLKPIPEKRAKCLLPVANGEVGELRCDAFE